MSAPLGPGDLSEVIYIDHYGNALTGLRAHDVPRNAVIAVRELRVSYAHFFSDVSAGSAFWYENSIGLVELAANCASAAALLGIRATRYKRGRNGFSDAWRALSMPATLVYFQSSSRVVGKPSSAKRSDASRLALRIHGSAAPTSCGSSRSNWPRYRVARPKFFKARILASPIRRSDSGLLRRNRVTWFGRRTRFDRRGDTLLAVRPF